MQKKRFLQVITSLAIVLTLLLSSCQESPNRQMTALVLGAQPEILKSGESEWQTLEHQAIINLGDTIRTGDDTWVFLEIDDGSLVGITPNTQATLVTFSESFKNPETLFDLANGLVYVRVTKGLGSGSFKVSTPVLTGSVVGSKMSVQYIQELGTADVTCFEGEVNAEINYDVEEGMTSCHMISGVKLTASSDDEWTMTRCEHPVLVKREETQAYSDFEKMALSVVWLRQTEQAKFATMTRIARFTKTPTPTEIILPTETVYLSPTPTFTATPRLYQRSTITVAPDAALSDMEAFNSGVHRYSFTATYFGDCSGPASGSYDEMEVRFEGNKVTILLEGGQSVFYKIDENTYQGDDGGDLSNVTFTDTGFVGDNHCGTWVYTRE